MTTADKRLIEIIDDHCKRVTQIAENVLQLSRRRVSQPQEVELISWLKQFIEDYKNSQAEAVSISAHCFRSQVVGQFDPGQLHQVISSLWDSGLRYRKSENSLPSIRLEAGV